MSLAHIHYMSPALKKQCGLYVTLPDFDEPPRPVVYLLHGMGDDYSCWQRRSSIERYAVKNKLIVVMPDGDRSFYTNAVDGSGNYEQHLLDTIAFIERVVICRANRASRGIGGLSMGGFGALKLALRHPQLFASVTSHSSPFSVFSKKIPADRRGLIRRIFGAKLHPSEDLFALTRKLKRSGKQIPRLHIDCGSEDGLIGSNNLMHEHLSNLGIKHQYAVHPGGHDWDYWDRHVQTALEFHKRVFDGSLEAERKSR